MAAVRNVRAAAFPWVKRTFRAGRDAALDGGERGGQIGEMACRASLLSLIALAGAPAAAQTAPADGLQLGLAARLRYETIAGQARAGFNERDDLLNLRTVATAEYRNGPVRAVAELWDSRAYLADRGTPLTTGEVDAVELVQAFVEVKPRAGVTVQAGRFLLNLGSRRLVAADDYRNTTSGSTGVRVDVATRDGVRATAIYTLPQLRRPDDLDALLANRVQVDRESFALVLWGGLASKARAVGELTVELSFFHLGERDAPGRPTRDRSLDTAGIRIVRDAVPGQLDYELEGIGQRGRAKAGVGVTQPRLPARAWFVHGDAGYTFAGRAKTRVSVEFDAASGDEPGGGYGRFDTLFGMRRAELAPAGLYNAIGRANLVSPGVRIESVPSSRTDWFAGYRALWLQSRRDSFSTSGVRDAGGASGSFAGHQLDTRLRHRLSPQLQLEVDAVLLAKGRFLRDAPNAPAGRWTRYLSLNATASL